VTAYQGDQLANKRSYERTLLNTTESNYSYSIESNCGMYKRESDHQRQGRWTAAEFNDESKLRIENQKQRVPEKNGIKKGEPKTGQ
jgi:hypothetical protein